MSAAETLASLQAEMAALVVERNRLRSALHHSDAWVSQYEKMPGHDAAARCMLSVIRAALKEPGK